MNTNSNYTGEDNLYAAILTGNFVNIAGDIVGAVEFRGGDQGLEWYFDTAEEAIEDAVRVAKEAGDIEWDTTVTNDAPEDAALLVWEVHTTPWQDGGWCNDRFAQCGVTVLNGFRIEEA